MLNKSTFVTDPSTYFQSASRPPWFEQLYHAHNHESSQSLNWNSFFPTFFCLDYRDEKLIKYYHNGIYITQESVALVDLLPDFILGSKHST